MDWVEKITLSVHYFCYAQSSLFNKIMLIPYLKLFYGSKRLELYKNEDCFSSTFFFLIGAPPLSKKNCFGIIMEK